MFLYGLDEAAGLKKLEEVYAAVREAVRTPSPTSHKRAHARAHTPSTHTQHTHSCTHPRVPHSPCSFAAPNSAHVHEVCRCARAGVCVALVPLVVVCVAALAPGPATARSRTL